MSDNPHERNTDDSGLRTAPSDFVVLHPDGRAEYHHTPVGRSLRDAIGDHVPNKASQGHRAVRMWFSDGFSAPGLYPNRLADDVLGQLGYTYQWYGPVAVSMDEDAHGETAALSAEVREAVTAAVDHLNTSMWGAAQRHAPELLEDLMYMGTVGIDGRPVHQYKHRDTRRYLNLEPDGQAWRIAVNADGQTLAQPLDLSEAKASLLQ
ncbi:hypothetical protein [Nocardia sp. IFM 10818]